MTTNRLALAMKRMTAASGRLQHDQGRIARRNGRRALLGAMKSVRLILDSDFPAIEKPKDKIDRIEQAARTQSWRRFEYRTIRHVTRRWDRDLAQRFVSHVAHTLQVPDKPIVFDIHEERLLGQHCWDRIRLNASQSDSSRWRTLIHELAHYRVHNRHQRAFVLEMAVIYRLWLDFLKAERVMKSKTRILNSAADLETPVPMAETGLTETSDL